MPDPTKGLLGQDYHRIAEAVEEEKGRPSRLGGHTNMLGDLKDLQTGYRI